MNELERPPAELKARLLAATARVPATRPGSWGRRLAVGTGAGVLWLGAMLVMKGIRHDWSELPCGSSVLTLGGLVASAALATGVALRRGRAMVGAGAGLLAAAVWGLPVVLAVLVSVVDPRGPSTWDTAPHAHPATVGNAIGCIEMTLVVALPLVGLGVMLLRGLTLARPWIVGACLGLGAATWAHMVVRLHCPRGGAAHALVGHLLPALPLMLVAAWALWVMDRRAAARRSPDRAP
jgi:hypothetical protein